MPTRSKTDHIIKAHGIHALKTSHPDVKKLKRQGNLPELHGNKVWASCYVLMDYLKKNPLDKGCDILDIGCGWGVLSSFLAKKFDANVHGADADKNLRSFYELTASINKVEIEFKHKRFEQLTGKHLKHYDVIVGSDICFWDELTDLLFKLINRGVKNGVEQIYIADPGRSPFWDLAKKCEKKFNSEVITHKTKTPKPSEKQVLVIDLR